MVQVWFKSRLLLGFFAVDFSSVKFTLVEVTKSAEKLLSRHSQAEKKKKQAMTTANDDE